MALGTNQRRDYALAASRRLAETPLSEELQSSTYGALKLVAAEAAAGAGDLTTSDDLLEQATRGAEQLGSTLHRTVWFGIPEVAITGMAIALQLGRFDEAIRLSGGVNIPKEASVDLRVRYYLTTAYAYSRKGEDFAAAIALLEAERACPEDIRFDWMAHRTLQKLARRDHHLIRRDLAHLLAHAGLM
ncbi:hypothetical protein [Nocardia sp. XZ_19_369]|uniref:hypothetical protein n=1 Tax=Nocardia sp. XZ_19_369 TaxID=2769487 RepID=UPI00188DEC3D|nr:hypothetical protein [Nocardia sp. XZ_19_369]